jgi:hypothetical protein
LKECFPFFHLGLSVVAMNEWAHNQCGKKEKK